MVLHLSFKHQITNHKLQTNHNDQNKDQKFKQQQKAQHRLFGIWGLKFDSLVKSQLEMAK